MTAAAAPPKRHAAGGAMVGTGPLVRFLLRRDRVKLPGWVAGAGLFMLYLAAAIPAAYGTEEDLAGAAQLFGEPVSRLMIGPGYGFEDPTLERFIANGYGLYFLLLAALMSMLLVTRHTRLEEQTGRAELVRANVLGRYAPLTAALIVASITNVAAAALVAVVMLGVGGFAVEGSLLFAAAMAVTGMSFAGVTALTVQLSAYSRTAAGLAGIVLGLAFVLRSGGDMARQGGSALSWSSPLGWGQQTAPFVLDRWWPLALTVIFGMVVTAGGYLLAARRDFGAGLLSARPGSARGRPHLGSPLGLASRLQRPGILGWTAALAVSGLAFGAYAEALLTAADDMPEAFLELFGGRDSVLDGYLAYMAVFMAYVVSIYAVLAVRGLRTEETGGRGEPVLATPVGRPTWLGANLAVTAGAATAMMLATGAGTGIGAAVVTGDASHIGTMTVAHLVHVPAVLVVLALAALLFGALPRALSAIWVIVVYGTVVGTFGPMLDLPPAAYDLSPYEHAARLPLESFGPAPLLVLAAIAGVAAALALGAFRRRDLDLT